MKWKLVFFMCCLIISAQSQPLTLREAIDLSLKHNFDIQLSRNEVEISKLNNSLGMSGGLPTVSATASDQESMINLHQKLNSGTEIKRNAVTSNALNAGVAGSVVLYNGYKIKATKEKLATLQMQSESNLNASILTVVENVMMSYFAIVKQQRYIENLEQSIELSEKQLFIVKSKQEVGLANNADLFQSEIDLNSRKQEKKQQEVILTQSMNEFRNLLNVSPDVKIEIQDSIVNENDIQYDDVIQSMKQYPELVSLEQQIKVNELIEKEINAQRKLSLRGNLGFNLSNNKTAAGQVLLNQTYGPYIGMSLSLPIYNGGINKRQSSIAKLNTQQASLMKEKTLLNYTTAIQNLYQTYTMCKEQLKTQEATYQLSKQLVELSSKRFELAAATILELRESQKSFDDAAFKLVSLQYTMKIAEIELKKISNQLVY